MSILFCGFPRSWMEPFVGAIHKSIPGLIESILFIGYPLLWVSSFVGISSVDSFDYRKHPFIVGAIHPSFVGASIAPVQMLIVGILFHRYPL